MSKHDRLIDEQIKTSKGFYIGDICYVLSSERLGLIEQNKFDMGKLTDGKSGLSYVANWTAHGDGHFRDQTFHVYTVDSGIIGVVPLELVENTTLCHLGRVIECCGEARVIACKGVYNIFLPNGEQYNINTRHWFT